MNARGNVPVAATLGLALLVSALLGCAAEGDNSASPAERPTGTVNILFTDAPSDDFSAINVTISRIELLPFNDDDADSDTDADDSDLSSNDGDSDSDRPNRRAMLFSGDATFDLLRLENFTNLFSITPNVPSGEYRKIRLTVSALELIDADTGLPILLDVPGNGKIDLLSRSPFLVEPDTTLLVTIDIDAKRSIHVSADDEDGYRFRPVVFVSVNNAPSDPGNPGETGDPPDPGDPGDPGVPAEVPVKFVRVQGFMNRSDLANGSFGMQVPNIGGEQFNIEMQTGAPVILSTGNLAAQNFEVSDNLSTAVGSFDEN
ncbi:MAG: DUF4382 domain-containing protein, partial [Gammaproteobacteria bacterium]|nr:DUF4382 domain-containing protein [Gammaproteobacteria bacterium]